MKRFVENGALKERENGNIPYAEIISFVRKTEDFMEMLGVDTIEQLKSVFDEGFGKQQSLITENIELKKELEKYKIKDTIGLADFINKTSKKLAIKELEKAKIEFETYYADRLNNYPEYLEERIDKLKGENSQ